MVCVGGTVEGGGQQLTSIGISKPGSINPLKSASPHTKLIIGVMPFFVCFFIQILL